LFSPLGKLADWAIYFACVNFFIFFLNSSDHSENNYLSIYWTDFNDFFHQIIYLHLDDRSGELFCCSRDVAMAINFGQNLGLWVYSTERH